VGVLLHRARKRLGHLLAHFRPAQDVCPARAASCAQPDAAPSRLGEEPS
jgi:hypothetical protein